MSMDIQNAIDEFAHREVTKTERERGRKTERRTRSFMHVH